MKRIALCLFLLASPVWAQQKAPPAGGPVQQTTPNEGITSDDAKSEIESLGAELAMTRLRIESLQRQVREWKSLALKLKSQESEDAKAPTAKQ